TRNPDGIARGLQALLMRGGGITGGAWADHLFIVGGNYTRRSTRQQQRAERLREQIARDTAGKSGADKAYAALSSYARAAQEQEADVRAEAVADDQQESADGLHS